MPNTWNPNRTEAVQTIDNSAYYQVLMNGVYQNQAIKNVLWYRVGIDVVPGDLNLFGAEHLAQCIYDSVWRNNWITAASTLYTLQDITVVPYNGFFDPIYNLPFIREVNEQGQESGTPEGPAPCITLRFVLEPQIVGLNGFFPPRRGYLSYGPIREIDVDYAGRLAPSAEAFYETRLNCVAQDVSGLPWPISYFPIRMRLTRVGNVLTLTGWTDVQGVDVRPIASFRRSRVPEA